MANKLYEENSIMDIASAIREKNGTTTTYNVAEMGDAIRNISIGGGITPSGEITIKENGTYDVTNYASAFVDIASGGNSSVLPSNVKVGVLELENDSATAVTVTHGSGVVPRVVACIPIDYISTKGTIGGLLIEGYFNGLSCTDNTGIKSFSTSVNAIQNITEQTFDFTPRSASYPLINGSYLWVAIS